MDASSIELPADARSVRTARQFVEESLTGSAVSDVVETAVLLVSELVTNAVLHAKTSVILAIRAVGDSVRVEVTDQSARSVRVRDYDRDATTGRGLALIEALATRWGSTVTPPGKTVWFEV